MNSSHIPNPPLKIAMISMLGVFPTRTGNAMRIVQMCKAIGQLGHRLDYIRLTKKPQVADLQAHLDFFGEGHYFQLNAGSRLDRLGHRLNKSCFRFKRWLQRKLLNDEAGYYEHLDLRWRNAWSKQLRQLHRDYDVVLVEYVFNSRALLAFPAGVRKLIDTHDSFAHRHRPFLASGHTHGYWLSLTPRDENTGFRRADTVMAIQQDEAGHFHGQLMQEGAGQREPEIIVVSHFLDLADPVQDHGTNHAGLYLASDNLSNRISSKQFIEQVLPLVVAAIPDFRLKVIGSICPHLPDHPNVDKLGFVDDLKQVFAQAPFSINPTVSGTGINIKILDAMGAGVATASTATGARGLPTEFRNGVVVAADQDHRGFANAIIALATDPALRQRLGQAAYADAQRWNTQQLQALEHCLRGGDGAHGSAAA